ncbi:hypothetical protein OSTOST_03695 [Ostertagia ostertagi]
MLGAGTLFLYLGYIMQGFISEAVIHAGPPILTEKEGIGVIFLKKNKEEQSGVVLRRLIKKCHDWGLIVTITMHFLAVSSALVLIVLSVPDMATIEPTSAPTLLIKPRRTSHLRKNLVSPCSDAKLTRTETSQS